MKTINFIETETETLVNLIDEKIQRRLNEFEKNLQKEPDDFMPRDETISFLKISYGCLHKWTQKGIVKKFKIGNKVFYSRKQIMETLLNSNK